MEAFYAEHKECEKMSLILLFYVVLLMKPKKGASMKRVSAKFGVSKSIRILENPKIQHRLGAVLSR
jgi:hypothetical protein